MSARSKRALDVVLFFFLLFFLDVILSLPFFQPFLSVFLDILFSLQVVTCSDRDHGIVQAITRNYQTRAATLIWIHGVLLNAM